MEEDLPHEVGHQRQQHEVGRGVSAGVVLVREMHRVMLLGEVLRLDAPSAPRDHLQNAGLPAVQDHVRHPGELRGPSLHAVDAPRDDDAQIVHGRRPRSVEVVPDAVDPRQAVLQADMPAALRPLLACHDLGPVGPDAPFYVRVQAAERIIPEGYEVAAAKRGQPPHHDAVHVQPVQKQDGLAHVELPRQHGEHGRKRPLLAGLLHLLVAFRAPVAPVVLYGNSRHRQPAAEPVPDDRGDEHLGIIHPAVADLAGQETAPLHPRLEAVRPVYGQHVERARPEPVEDPRTRRLADGVGEHVGEPLRRHALDLQAERVYAG